MTQNSDELDVKKVYPRAVYEKMTPSLYFIYSDRTGETLLGAGRTIELAWHIANMNILHGIVSR